MGDAHGLGLPESGFDVVLRHTLTSPVADPVSVLGEARRRLRPGCRLVVVDSDYVSLALATDAPDDGEATDRFSPMATLSLYRLLGGAGQLDLRACCSGVC